jgi:acylphosphatase
MATCSREIAGRRSEVSLAECLWAAGRTCRSAMERSRLHIIYTGHVQGVGFRYTVKSLAPGFEVTGTIRNLPGGQVELVAEGAREELRAFQQAIRDSGLGRLIIDEQTSWNAARDEFRGFTISG